MRASGAPRRSQGAPLAIIQYGIVTSLGLGLYKKHTVVSVLFCISEQIFKESALRPILSSSRNVHIYVPFSSQLFNRPGVAGAVLQTALSFIHSFIHSFSD